MAMNHLLLCIAIVFTTVGAAFANSFERETETRGFGTVGTRISNISFPVGGEFESNLESVLEDIGVNTSLTGFNVSVKGQPPNRVYGRIQCRGDASTTVCYKCTQDIIAAQKSTCNYSISCFVFQDMCNLRYANYSFMGLLDTSLMATVYGAGKGSNASLGYANLVAKLVDSELSTKASSAGNKGFAAGSVKYSDNTTIYVLVQCSRDLSSLNCTKCLSAAAAEAIDDRSSSSRSLLLWPSCFLDYDAQPLFNSTGKEMSNAIVAGVGGASVAILIVGLLI